MLHCSCSPTGPGGPGRPGLPGGPSIPFGPGIPGVPVKYGHFNQIRHETCFSADLEMLQSEISLVTNEPIVSGYFVYVHFADLQLIKETNYKAKNTTKQNIGAQLSLLLLLRLCLLNCECPWLRTQ